MAITLEEVKDLKKEIAMEVYHSIIKFESQTGLIINGILLGRLDKDKNKLTAISLEVRL